MKKVKLLLLIIMVMLISGCTVDYSLIVTSNNKIKENVKASVPNAVLPENKKEKKKYLKAQIASYSTVGGYKNYDFTYKIGEEISYIQLDTWHQSFDRYKNSIIYNNLFENIYVVQDSEFTTFETVGKYFYSDLYGDREIPDPDFYMGDINVKIRLHNNIIESNADNVDEKNNTLEWTITSKDKVKSIYFKIGKEKKYDIILMDMFLLNKNAIVITSTSIALIAIVAYYIYRKIQKTNSI